MNITLKLLVVISFIICISQICCNTTEPPINGNKPTLTLKLEDVSCTEAWIQFSSTNLQTPNSLNLFIDEQLKKTINLTKTDTLLYIDSLLPNQTYKIYAAIEQLNNVSNEITLTTMDTTSHNFTFQSWTFGGTAGSSTLYDVAIIDENNIWAVGEIYVADTSINGYTAYNAVHWDGTEWELKLITYGGNFWVIRTVFAFSENDIWFSGYVRYFNGQFIELPIPDILIGWGINKLWGSSSSDLYAVGNNGNIAHYNGTNWQKIESGTTLNINDIWGDYNQKTQQWEVLAVGGNILQGTQLERVILKIEALQDRRINTDGTYWPLRTVWFKSMRKYYTAGSGVYEKVNIDENIWKNGIYDISTYSINRLRGDLINNVAATGGLGELLHFNGYNWKSYIAETALQAGNFLGLDIKSNVIITVGQNNPKAVITIGRR